MVIKKDFVRRLNIFILVSFSLFVLTISIFFYSTFRSEVNAIYIMLASLSGQQQTSLLMSIQGISTLFYGQLLTFVLAMGSLLFAFWFTSQKYMVEKKNALIDPLTQIFNRKAVFFVLKQELKKTERKENHPTTVALMDLDYFKVYNDKNGHVAGDRLLKRFANILEENVREYDIVGRYGGEEFIIVFPETDVEDAAKICERIREEVEDTQFYGQHNMPFKKVTVSIGLADVKSRRIKRETIINNADEFLYKAKHAGRNKVLFE